MKRDRPPINRVEDLRALSSSHDKESEFDYNAWCKQLEREKGEDWNERNRQLYLLQGTEFLFDVRNKNIDVMIFMDRSARPLALFLRSIWYRVFPDQKPPEMRFMNGDRLGVYNTEGIEKEVTQYKETYDGKNVLLVDEVVEYLTTLNRLQEILAKIFSTDSFPQGVKVMKGALARFASKSSDPLDVSPPQLFSPPTLGLNLLPTEKAVFENPGEIHVRRRKDIPPSESISYRLLQIGKHQTIDPKYLENLLKIRVLVGRDNEHDERLKSVKGLLTSLMQQ